MLRANPQEFHIWTFVFLHRGINRVIQFTWGMASKSSSSKLAGWRLVCWGDISFFMSARSESAAWKFVWVIILLFAFLHHASQIIYHSGSNHAQTQTFVHLEEFFVFLVSFSEPSSIKHNPNMFGTTAAADSLLINYLIVYEASSALPAPLIGPH